MLEKAFPLNTQSPSAWISECSMVNRKRFLKQMIIHGPLFEIFWPGSFFVGNVRVHVHSDSCELATPCNIAGIPCLPKSSLCSVIHSLHYRGSSPFSHFPHLSSAFYSVDQVSITAWKECPAFLLWYLCLLFFPAALQVSLYLSTSLLCSAPQLRIMAQIHERHHCFYIDHIMLSSPGPLCAVAL